MAALGHWHSGSGPAAVALREGYGAFYSLSHRAGRDAKERRRRTGSASRPHTAHAQPNEVGSRRGRQARSPQAAAERERQQRAQCRPHRHRSGGKSEPASCEKQECGVECGCGTSCRSCRIVYTRTHTHIPFTLQSADSVQAEPQAHTPQCHTAHTDRRRKEGKAWTNELRPLFELRDCERRRGRGGGTDSDGTEVLLSIRTGPDRSQSVRGLLSDCTANSMHLGDSCKHD